ncbi:MAG TPA: ParB/RepB/Spo0J family partition protein [Terriglobales bacterium]|nr:ParB/RepB/Spo0J family partition protein [Terriglobales bacterium]
MTANKAVAEQDRAAGTEKAREKGAPQEKRRALGRGLESLLPGVSRAFAGSGPVTVPAKLGTATESGESRVITKDTREHEAGRPAEGPAAAQPVGEAAGGGVAAGAAPATPGGPRPPSERPLAADILGHEADRGSEAVASAGVAPVAAVTGSGVAGVAAAAADAGGIPSFDRAGRFETRETWGSGKHGVGSRESGVRSQPSGISGGEAGRSGTTEGGSAEPWVIAELRAQAGREVLQQLALELIDENPYQTRFFSKVTDDGPGMEELVASVQANGVITPIMVRPGKDGRYTLVAGERRTRASKLAGRETIPAIVREVSNQQAAELTVIENLQRQDLNCLDQARAFVLLSQSFGMTQDQIGERVGMSRGAVSNYMRLVRLPDEVQTYLTSCQLSYSHARQLLNLDQPEAILKWARRAVKEALSVEQLDRLMSEERWPGQKQPPQPARARWVDPNVRAAQRDLERVLGVRVRIRDRKGRGKITIEYGTLEDFDRVLGMLRGRG